MSSVTSSPFSPPSPPVPAEKVRTLLAQALAAQRAGKPEEAISAYDQVLGVAPGNVAALVNKGAALRALGRPEEALACYWRAIGAAPDNLEGWSNAGNALHDLGRTEEARAALEIALRKSPVTAAPWLTLGNVLVRQGHAAAAEACFRRAVALAPKNSAARTQLARLLEMAQPEVALVELERLRRELPDDPVVAASMGQALIGLNRLDEAEEPLRHAAELQPDYMYAHLGLARLLLLRGDLAEGWREYEWRRKISPSRHPKQPGPEWDGSDPAGKTILIQAEQGFGDTLQFVRLLPLLADRGARIVVLCQKSMFNLVGRISGVVSAQANLHPLPAYDYWATLLSLPRLMGIDSLADIPSQVPYVPIPEPAPLPAPVGTRLRVGLVWAGSPTHGHDQYRSAGLEKMLPITGVNGAAFYSLQVGPRAGDAGKIAHPALIASFAKAPADYLETARIVAGLDLVITVDTSVAHLAGAMGKPVWVMIPALPDWRWGTEGEDCRWYPTMRLFRQDAGGQWEPVVDRIAEELAKLVAKSPRAPGEEAEIQLPAIFAKPGTDPAEPRFRMTAPRALMSDPGIRYLVHRERTCIGYEYGTRSFLDAHLRPGDVFIDVGAHWGIMSLQAATRWPGEIDALAVEPLPANLPHLKRWIDDNGLGERIEIVAAAASDKAGRGELKPESTMGHSLIKKDKGAIPVVTVDALMAERPHLADRDVIVKIDVEGFETEVVKGMAELLASGRVKAVIWERGHEYDRAEGQKRLTALRRHFAALGFTAWRFESEDAAGDIVPFEENGRDGNIIELAKGIAPLQGYGLPKPPAPPQPADRALDAALDGRAWFNRSVDAHKSGKGKEALEAYGKAAMRDATIGELWNNLGVTLRGMKRLAAAEACYSRGLALKPDDIGLMSNFGNLLRERGKLDQSLKLHERVLASGRKVSDFIYNAAIIHRDLANPAKAQKLLEEALSLAPKSSDLPWELALVHLQQGDYATGFPAYEARWAYKKIARRKMPMPEWKGEALKGEILFVTDEQGFGDVLQFARFIPELKRRGAGKIILECQPELMRLLEATPGIDAVLPRERAVPHCEYHVPLLSLPGILGTTLKTLPANCPYLKAPETEKKLESGGRLKVGLVWAGQTKPRDRSIGLDQLLPLLGDPRLAPFSLQVGARAADLKKTGADAFITDLSPFLHDFAETAALLKQLDLLITIDTAAAHLAGGLGVPTFLLLLHSSDWRWFDRRSDSPWYPSLTLFRQARPHDWTAPLTSLKRALAAFADERH